MVHSTTPHPELQTIRSKLSDILKSITAFGPGVTRPPVIDASIEVSGEASDDVTTQQQTLPGLRALRDAVKRDLDVLEKFLADSSCASLPALSTNAPYLISVWNEVLMAPPPVTAIWAAFSESGKAVAQRRRGHPKEDGVKVDVVADGGRKWIRVNTIKNSRILAEFREIDSYQTDSEDDDDDLSLNRRPTLAQSEFDNSVLRMARSLVNAAKENTITGTSNSPSITMQITRLDPSPSNPKEHDPRIAQTLEILRDMGVEVHLGERENSVLARSFEQKTIPVQKLKPSTRLNLDLSILVALVSDLTHSPLPLSPEDADARFTPSEVYLEWKKARLEATTKNGGATETIDLETLSRPSRALSNQALQEMVKGLFQEIHDCISLLQGPEDVRGTSIFPSVEFWTTPEARDRCLKIISKIGGPNEKRRAHALFYQLTAPSLSKVEAEELFWQNSRYPPGFLPLLPIRLLPDSMPGGDQDLQVFSQNGGSTHPQVLPPFFHTLAHTCRAILEHEVIPDPRTLRVLPSPNQSHKNIVPSHTADDDDNEEIQRATVTRLNPRLTAHTVQSMLWGAVNGWTTLTANRTSVKAILREVTSARFGGTPRDSLPKLSRVEDHEAGDGVDKEAEIAALWVVDPRSLAEGMRFDFKSSLNDS